MNKILLFEVEVSDDLLDVNITSQGRIGIETTNQRAEGL
jgi:hypothetical protein